MNSEEKDPKKRKEDEFVESVMSSNFMEDSAFKFITSVERENGYPVASYILKTLGFEFDRIENVEVQKEYISLWAKAVRPDVTVRTNSILVTLDMQNEKEADLADRVMEYAISVALSSSQKGEKYRILDHKTWVVFLCNFDLFGGGEVVYTFQMGGKDFEKYFKGFEMGIKIVNLKAARKLKGDELGTLARDLDERDPHKMESNTFKYAAKNYKLKEEGRNKMSSEARKIYEEGMKEAKKEAKKEAIRERSIEVAKDMLESKEYSYEQISKISRLSMAEVRNLAVSYS